MKKMWMVVGTVILVALVAAGSFWGGMQYESNRANQVRAEFMNARGLSSGVQFPGDRQFPTDEQLPAGDQAPGFLRGGGTTGQVKTIDGNVLTLSTAQDVTTVLLSESTQIEKSVAGAIADLQPGMRVMVTGQSDGDGNLNASRVQILNGDSPALPDPPPAGTEP